MVRAVLAIDPGGKHVGWAEWWKDEGRVRPLEYDADDALPAVEEWLETTSWIYRVLVVEEFRLYPGQAGAQSWSEMETSEMVGALKWAARKSECPVVMQGANVKKPTARQLRARGIERGGSGPHARDAELHLLHYLLKEELWEG